jgi:hypothetical protein
MRASEKFVKNFTNCLPLFGRHCFISIVTQRPRAERPSRSGFAIDHFFAAVFKGCPFLE